MGALMHSNWSKFNRLKYYTFPGDPKSMRWDILKTCVTLHDTFFLCQRGRGDYVTLSFTNDIDPYKMMPEDKYSGNRRDAERTYKSVMDETLFDRKILASF